MYYFIYVIYIIIIHTPSAEVFRNQNLFSIENSKVFPGKAGGITFQELSGRRISNEQFY